MTIYLIFRQFCYINIKHFFKLLNFIRKYWLLFKFLLICLFLLNFCLASQIKVFASKSLHICKISYVLIYSFLTLHLCEVSIPNVLANQLSQIFAFFNIAFREVKKFIFLHVLFMAAVILMRIMTLDRFFRGGFTICS